MKLNRKWVLVLALALSVAMATTGTLAYLTDEDADVNTMTLGKVEIVQNEQERTADGKLDAFTQDKPLYPAVYTGTSIPYADETEWPNGDEAWKTVVENVNVIDKFVTVTNTGKSPAYVRTIIAYEGNAINGPDIHILHNTPDHSNATVGAEFASVDFIENVTIGGARFDVIVYTYANPLQAGKTTIPSLKQVYMDKTSDNEQVEAIDTTKNGKYDILVLSQAVQTNGFETVGAAAALNEAFNEGKALDATKVAEWFAGYQTWEEDGKIGSPNTDPETGKNDTNNPPVIAEIWVSTSAELDEALTDEKGYTAIGLKNGEYNIPASGKGKTVTLIGESKNAVITVVPAGQGEANGQLDYNFDGATVTFENLTIKTNSQMYAGFARMSGTYNNCVIQNTYNLGLNTKNAFNGCEINITNEYLRVNGAKSATFDNCVFNTDGRAILVFQDGTNLDQVVTVKDCTFNATATAKTWNKIHVAAVSIDSTAAGTSYTVNFEGNNVVDEDFAGLVQIKADRDPSIVTVNGATVSDLIIDE